MGKIPEDAKPPKTMIFGGFACDFVAAYLHT
jgi:hypothetical protein